MVTATITFDGDDEVFDGTSNAVTAQSLLQILSLMRMRLRVVLVIL
jgi:hypothetical protein